MKLFSIQEIQDFAIKIINFYLFACKEDGELSIDLISVADEIKKDIRTLHSYLDLKNYLGRNFERIIDILKAKSNDEKINKISTIIYVYGIDFLTSAFYGKFASYEDLQYYMMNVSKEEAEEFAFKVSKITFIVNNLNKFYFIGMKIISSDEDSKINQNIKENLKQLSREELTKLVLKHAEENPILTLISFVKKVEITTN